MANVAHSTLTGADLHEPKGVASAPLGTVYVANGSGSGSWADVGTASFTGMVADFVAPIPPSGWLELDGTVISTSTYSGLYAVMTIQSSGTRTNASPVITSIASTTNFKVGYYVFGTGISTGTTIISIDSATQITLSNNASSSGTAAFAVSPWLLNTGTIKLPDLTTSGLFRRSRTGTTKVGEAQTSQNVSHTHSVIGTSGGENQAHTHTAAGTTSITNTDHSHASPSFFRISGGSAGGGGPFGGELSASTGSMSNNASHNHTFSVVTTGQSASHNHDINFTSGSSGSAEGRPANMTFLVCVKT